MHSNFERRKESILVLPNLLKLLQHFQDDPHCLIVSLLLSPAFCAPFSPNAPVVARNVLAKRAVPDTGDDFPDTEPHPSNLDKVEAGFNDAIELASYALTELAQDDNTILKHYFNEGDKDEVKNVF